MKTRKLENFKSKRGQQLPQSSETLIGTATASMLAREREGERGREGERQRESGIKSERDRERERDSVCV